MLYGLTIYLFSKSQKSPPSVNEEVEIESWEPKRWLILAGIFPLATTLGELLMTGLFEALAIVFWFGGILFGVVVFFKALRMVYTRKGAQANAEV